MEQFTGPPQITIQELPAIRLVSLKPKQSTSLLQRLAHATQRRKFILIEDWHVDVSAIDYNDQINGKIRIPKDDKTGNPIQYDGASIPLPWLISVLTLGILRPLGIMLIASIVHDYAYKFGHLQHVADDDSAHDIAITRHHADRFFQETIRVVNRVPLVGYIAWLVIKMGWFFGVPYAGNRFDGGAPLAALLIVIALVSAFLLVGSKLGMANLCGALLVVYLGVYITSIFASKALTNSD